MGATSMKATKQRGNQSKLPSRVHLKPRRGTARKSQLNDPQHKDSQSERKDDAVEPSADECAEDVPPAEPERVGKALRLKEGDARLGNSPLCASHTREYLILVDNLENKEHQQYKEIRKYAQQFLELMACLHCMSLLLTIILLYTFSQYLIDRLRTR